jgi:hypothetical protein
MDVTDSEGRMAGGAATASVNQSVRRRYTTDTEENKNGGDHFDRRRELSNQLFLCGTAQIGDPLQVISTACRASLSLR